MKNLPIHTIETKYALAFELEQSLSQYYRDCKVAVRAIEMALAKYEEDKDMPLDKQSEIKKAYNELVNKRYDQMYSRLIGVVGEDIS